MNRNNTTARESIVEASPSDAGEILSVQKRAYQSKAAVYSDYKTTRLTQTVDELEAEFDSHVFLKAVVSGSVVGSVRAQCLERVCHIEGLVVEPGHQDYGIGKRLMQAMEARFPDATCFELFTDNKGEKSLGLYQRLGYTEIRRKKISTTFDFVFLSKNNHTAGI